MPAMQTLNRITMPRTITCTLLAALAIFATGSIAGTTESTAQPAPRKTRTGNPEIIRSVVEIIVIDPKARAITFKREDGNMVNVVAAPAVRNFASLRVGEFVVAEYGRARALSMKKIAAEEGAGDPAPAAAPGNSTRSVTADIIAIDDKKGFATLKAARGLIIDIAVKDRRTLGAVKIGDHVLLQYQEAVAVSVKPARSRR